MLIIQATLQRPSPRLHQRATQLREIAPGIIGFRGIPQVVGRCRFAGQPPIVPIIHLRGAVLDTVRNPWATAGISSRRRNAVQAMSDSGFPFRPAGNTRWLSSPTRLGTSRSISTARPDRGNLCSFRAFMRSVGTVQTVVFRSISSHVARRTSPDRAAVSTRNSNDKMGIESAPDSRIRFKAEGTSA